MNYLGLGLIAFGSVLYWLFGKFVGAIGFQNPYANMPEILRRNPILRYGLYTLPFIVWLVGIGLCFIYYLPLGIVSLAVVVVLWIGLSPLPGQSGPNSRVIPREISTKTDYRGTGIGTMPRDTSTEDTESQIEAVLDYIGQQDPGVSQGLREERKSDPELDKDLIQLWKMVAAGKSDRELNRSWRKMLSRKNERIASRNYTSENQNEAETTDHGVSNTTLTDTKQKSIVQLLWNGDFPLSNTYWIYGYLGSILFALPLIYWETALTYKSWSRTFIWVFLSYVAWTMVYRIFISVAIWRSASKYTGPNRWAVLAKLTVVIGVLRLLVNLNNYSPVYIELARIGLNLDESYKSVITRLNDKEVMIEGGIGYGLTRELSKILEANQNVNVIQLESWGGLANESYRLRDFLKAKGVITYTETECSSGCVVAFMGGKTRILHKDGKLGFHSPAQPKLRNPTLKDKREFQSSIKEDKDLFIQSGIGAELVEKAFRIPSDEMWYPSRQELINAGVITHTYDGSKSIPHQ